MGLICNANPNIHTLIQGNCLDNFLRTFPIGIFRETSDCLPTKYPNAKVAERYVGEPECLFEVWSSWKPPVAVIQACGGYSGVNDFEPVVLE